MKLEKAESKSSWIRRSYIFDAYETGLEYKKDCFRNSFNWKWDEGIDWIKHDH